MRKQKTMYVAVKGDEVAWWSASEYACDARKQAARGGMDYRVFFALKTKERRWAWLYRRGWRIKQMLCEVRL